MAAGEVAIHGPVEQTTLPKAEENEGSISRAFCVSARASVKLPSA